MMSFFGPYTTWKPATCYLLLGTFLLFSTVPDTQQHRDVSSNEQEVELLPNDLLGFIPHEKTNVFQQTQNVIYTAILETIRTAIGNDGDTSQISNATNTLAKAGGIPMVQTSNRRTKFDGLPSVVMNNQIYTNGVDQNAITSTAANESSQRGEYFLGYSNNVFGSHTKYIERMSGEIRKNPEHYPSYNVLHTGQQRRKRSVLHLYNMVLCATGCNPLSYKGYGCYCGFLGSGYVVDGIDRCCKIHDWCYDTAGCPMFLEYFIPYLWKCYKHQYPLCAIDHGEFGGPGSCAQRLCECDRQLAQCLKMYPCPSSKALCTSSPWRLLQNIIMN